MILGCKKRQHGQIQFDNEQAANAELEMMNSSDGMYLLSDKTILITLELANTDDKEQTATFNLKGFTAAYHWCNK